MAVNPRNTVGNYVLREVLGTGDFDCRIRKCSHKETNVEFAVKIYSKQVLRESRWMWDQLAEAVQVLRSMPKNEHVVEMVECFETETHLYILMPYVKSLSLYHWCHDPERFVPAVEKKRQIFEQFMRGIAHMHKNHVAHLGVAPDHILYSDSGEVKISFLVACKNVIVKDGVVDKISVTCGTTHTVAPEVLRHQPYDPFAADIWSCGVVLYFLLNNGRYPFDGANTTKHILRDERRPCDPGLPTEAMDLLDRMLDKTPETRITYRDVLAHPWVVKGAAKTMHAEVSWANEAKTQLRIKLPDDPSRTQRDRSALTIQAVWRFVRAKSRGTAVTHVARDASSNSSLAHISAAETSDLQPATALRLAQLKWKQNKKWDPALCGNCGHPPPQRVRPGQPPYPDAGVTKVPLGRASQWSVPFPDASKTQTSW
jgi:serine/threonine protein kinase